MTDHPLFTLIESGDLAKLEAGELPPREGDFIASKLNRRVCGIVTRIGTAGRKDNSIAAFYIAGHPEGQLGETVILGNDVVFIAPFEAGMDEEGEWL